MKKHNHYGFTIVELLVVIVVVGILAAITIVAYNGLQARAKQALVESDISQIKKKIKVYKAAHGGTVTPTHDQLMTDGDLGNLQPLLVNGEYSCFTAMSFHKGNYCYYMWHSTGNNGAVYDGYQLYYWNYMDNTWHVASEWSTEYYGNVTYDVNDTSHPEWGPGDRPDNCYYGCA